MATLLALLSSVSWGSSDFLGGQASRKYPVFFVVLASQVFGLALMLVIATATAAWGTSTDYLPWAVLASVSGFTGIGLFYAAMASGSVGVVSPITSLGSLGPIVLGLFTGDTPTTLQYAGLLAALVGVVLASGPELSGETGARSVVLALCATVLFGVCLIGIAFGSKTSAVMTMTGMRVSTVLIMSAIALVALARGRRVHLSRRRDLGVLAAVGLLDVSANLLFGIASTAGMLALVSVLGSLYPVVTVLLAWRFLHERLEPIQYLGVGLALGGVAAIVA
ncbi:MAG TPA: DMT family transporter [Actinomycetota bacterium]|nr:DMT family transporter [Actinomycetota bacterium]